MPRGDKLGIMKYPIPIPHFAEQQRIVAILDKFDALVNDLSDGLPAELNARRKQYEYYRNKLLTFKPLKKEHAVNTRYNLVAESPESTVVAEYTAQYRTAKSYQGEAELENRFIEELKSQAYEHLSITSEEDLVKNLRIQLEKLNDFEFSDTEWEKFFTGEISNPNQGMAEKTAIIQEDYIRNLKRDDGTVKNIYLLRKDNIHDNILQVINQYATEEGQRANRYDVTVLVNGLPLVHVELKRRGVAIQEAFNQISRYQRESFWAGTGLFEYVQIFVISNGTHTKYYSNTTRSEHIRESREGTIKKGKRSSNSFEFTSWWADANNKPITDLADFAKTFFAKHALLNIITRYCVFTTDKQLLVMRPYQIVATEKNTEQDKGQYQLQEARQD